ncbi:MAG TPA: hypothetical protein VM118_07690 [Acidobacteriota bacterium]|nr:hypothetical protein [Acidobacteriota bacterium]
MTALISELAGADPAVVEQKLHIKYLQDYFDALLAFASNGGPARGTIVIETPYVDKDFLIDYQSYYVRCHWPYERFCSRLHFFDVAFGESEFVQALLQCSTRLSTDYLNDHYLGFLVIKKLPEAMFGRSCLKTYPNREDGRYYPITRPYYVNLFGIDLHVESLAFQEQDTVVAACATSALWSAFHYTSSRFQHALPSPVEITENATTGMPLRGRALPSVGLTVEQMARAISSVGLESEYLEPWKAPIPASSDWLFKAILYGYLQGRTPLLIGVAVIEEGNPSRVDYHAITGVGFRLGEDVDPLPGAETCLTSSRMTRLYSHDDQVGPFSRNVFDGVLVDLKIDGTQTTLFSLGTSWNTDPASTAKVRFVPMAIIVPIYHKIRIPITSVLGEVLGFDRLVEDLKADVPDLIDGRIEWDVFLSESCQLKRDLASQRRLPDEQLTPLLLKNFPRYLWRAIARSGDSVLAEIVFDATDFARGNYCALILGYDRYFNDVMGLLAQNDAVMQYAVKSGAGHILQTYRKSRA